MSTRTLPRKQGAPKVAPPSKQEETSEVAPSEVAPSEQEQGETNAQGEQGETSEVAPPAAPEGEDKQEETSEVAPSSFFSSEVDRVIPNRAPETGALPMVDLDSLSLAFVKVPHGDRLALLLSESQRLTDLAMVDPLAVDVSLILCGRVIGSHLDAAAKEKKGAKKVAPKVDPLAEMAGWLATFDVSRSLLLATLSEGDRETVEKKVAALLENADGFTATWPAFVKGGKKGAASKGAPSSPREGGGTDINAVLLAFAATQEIGATLPYAAFIGAAKESTGIETIGGSVSFALDNDKRIALLGFERATASKKNADGTTREIKAIRIAARPAAPEGAPSETAQEGASN